MSRISNLIAMPAHPVLGKLFNKLNQTELDAVVEFVRENDHLDDNAYMEKANRWHMDSPRPKHHSDMWAIVTQCKVFKRKEA